MARVEAIADWRIELGRLLEEAQAPLPLAQSQWVLYGAGTLGRDILGRLRTAGVEPVAFADHTPQKQGTVIDGVEVLALEEAARRFPSARFAVTIFNSKLRFVDARSDIARRIGVEAVSFVQLALMYPGALPPVYGIADPAFVRANAAAIEHLFDAVADDESRTQLIAHLRHRLTGDHDALPPIDPDQYFPQGVVEPLPTDILFIDGGAYDGDTLRDFLRRHDSAFARAVAVEPDPVNAAALRGWLQTIPHALRERIDVWEVAIAGEHGTALLSSTGTEGTAIGAGDTPVRTVVLDDLADDASPVYLKLDIEGQEWNALQAAPALLHRRDLRLAVSIYHTPEDLWRIPLHLRQLGFELRLRTHGPDGAGLVCYATRS